MAKPTNPVLQPGNALASGLVRCYPFNENSGRTIHDYSGQAGVNLTTRTSFVDADGTWGTDPDQGGYIAFNGSTRDARGSDAGMPAGNAPRTISILFRATTGNPPDYGYFMLGYGTNSNGILAVGLASPNRNSEPYQTAWLTTFDHGTGWTQSLIDGLWHLLHFTLASNGTVTVYVDGEQKTLGTNGGDFNPFSTVLSGFMYLGQVGGTGGSNPDGSNSLFASVDIGGVWAWNRVLSPQDVTSHRGDPWQMVRVSDPPTGYTLQANPASVLAGQPTGITAALTGTGAYLATPLVITLAGAGLEFAGPITISNGQTTGSTTATADEAGTHAVSGSHAGGGFSGGDGSTSFIATEPPDTSTYRPYGQVFDLLAPGRSGARARAITENGTVFPGLDWSTAGVRDLGSGQYGVTLLLPPVALWVQVDDGVGGPSLFDRWGGAAPGPDAGTGTAPTAEQVAAAVMGSTVDGETLTLILRLLRAEAVGKVDLATMPGYAIYRLPNGTGEAFRGTFAPGTGRGKITIPGGS